MKTILAVLVMALPAVALAHPMGNFTINHCSRLTAAPDALRLRYTLDMAELPTITERQDMDKDGDGQPSPSETAAYLADRVPKWMAKLKLMAGGAQMAWKVTGSRVAFTPGVANLATMRVEVTAAARWTPGRKEIGFEDANYPERPGWKEVVVEAAPGFPKPAGADAYTDRSRDLRRYPEDLIQNPPQEASAAFAVTVPAAKAPARPPAKSPAPAPRPAPKPAAPARPAASAIARAAAPPAVRPASQGVRPRPPAPPNAKAKPAPAKRAPVEPAVPPAPVAPAPARPAPEPSPIRWVIPALAAALLAGISLFLRRRSPRA